MNDGRNHSRLRHGATWLVLALMASAQAVLAQDDVPSLIWTTGAAGENVPERVRPGYTEFVLDNDGDTDYTLTIFRLREGATFEEFREANARVDAAFEGGGDVVTAMNEGLALVEVMGEVDAEAGAANRVGVALEQGDYVLDGVPHIEGEERTYATFEVAGEPGGTRPEPDVTIQMVDFAFAFPPSITAGEQIWHVVNRGLQLHHMIVFRLAEGTTADDLMDWVEAMEGPPPAEQTDYVGMMSPGRGVYQNLDLSPGDYVAVCFIADHEGEATGQLHVTLGMSQAFTVAAP